MKDVKPPKPKQEFPVTASAWKLYHRDYEFSKMKANKPKGFFFDFSKSDKPDPDAGPIWDGYLVSKTKGIKGTRLVAEFEVVETGTVAYNFKSQAYNVCEGIPLALHLFVSGGHFYSQYESDRWWYQKAYPLKAGVGSIDAPLDPELWSNAWGHKASETAELTAWFKNATTKAMYVGVTIGGGCFSGHGGNVTGGNSRVKVTRFVAW